MRNFRDGEISVIRMCNWYLIVFVLHFIQFSIYSTFQRCDRDKQKVRNSVSQTASFLFWGDWCGRKMKGRKGRLFWWKNIQTWWAWSHRVLTQRIRFSLVHFPVGKNGGGGKTRRNVQKGRLLPFVLDHRAACFSENSVNVGLAFWARTQRLRENRALFRYSAKMGPLCGQIWLPSPLLESKLRSRFSILNPRVYGILLTCMTVMIATVSLFMCRCTGALACLHHCAATQTNAMQARIQD